MSDSEEDNVLYASRSSDSIRQGKGLISGGSKRPDDIMNGPTDGRRLKKTIALCGSFIGLGLAVAVVGPTLQELQDHLSTDLPHISFIFTGRSIGYVVGSIVGGLLFEHFHPLMLISLTLAISGMGLMVMPQFLRLGPTIATISLVGVATGALDTGTNVVILRLWGKKSAPFMQALHFSFAVGAFISPLLASPFIGTHSNLTEVVSTTIPPNPSTIVALTSPTANVTFNSTQNITVAPDLPDSNGNRRKRSAADIDFQHFAASGEDITLHREHLKRSANTLMSSEGALHKDSQNIEHGTLQDETVDKILDDSGFNQDDFLQNKWTQPLKSRRILEEESHDSVKSGPETPSDASQNETDPSNDPDESRSETLLDESQKGNDPSNKSDESQPKIPPDKTQTTKDPPKTSVIGSTPATSTALHRDRFQAVYTIIGVFLILMALLFLYFFCTSPVESSFQQPSDLETGQSPSADGDFTYHILGLLFVFYFLYVGAEVGYGGYIYTFAISVSMQPKSAAHLNALFWGTFAFVRGVSIFIASLMSPLQMLVMDLIGCIMSSMVLAFFANTYDEALWIGTAFLGASMASLFPAGITWLESYAPVTGKMASFLVVGSAFGEMAIPILLGYTFGTTGPMSLMYLTFGISIFTTLIFGYAVYLAASAGKDVEGPMPEEEPPAVQILQGVKEEINLPNIELGSGPGQIAKPVLNVARRVKND